MSLNALLIGEAWGRHEENFHPFVGPAGQELARMGGESGLFPPLLIECKHCHETVQFGRCECGTFNAVSYLSMRYFWAKTRNYGIGVTNVFNEHPPKDNIELFFGQKQDPDVDLSFPPYKRKNRNFFLKKSHKHHLDRLYDEINDLKPNILIPLGNTACWAILDQIKISALRGTIVNTKFNIKAIPTFHPASTLHSSNGWAQRPTIISDFKKAAAESHSPLVTRNKIWLLKDPTIDEIREWFSIPAQRRVCDIESAFIFFDKAELDRMKKCTPKARGILANLISMVGFSRDEQNGIIIPFIKRNKENGSLEPYWSIPSHEVLAWKWVQYGLSETPELAFQNGMYDINRLILKGMRPKNMIHDSMLRSHALFPEIRKGLGNLNSLFNNEIAWKTMYGKGDSLKRDD